MLLDPRLDYVHLGADGEALRLPGGAAFWALAKEDMDRIGSGC